MLQKKKKLKLYNTLEIAMESNWSELYIDQQGLIYFITTMDSTLYCCNEDGSMNHAIDLKKLGMTYTTDPVYILYNDRVYIGISTGLLTALVCITLSGELIWKYESTTCITKEINREIRKIAIDRDNNIVIQIAWRDVTIPEKIAELKGSYKSEIISLSSEGNENWKKEIWAIHSPVILDKMIIMYKEFHEFVGYQLNGERIWNYSLGKYSLEGEGWFSYNGAFYLVISDWIESLYEKGETKILKLNKNKELEEILSMPRKNSFSAYTVNDKGMLYMTRGIGQLVKINLERKIIEEEISTHGMLSGIEPPVYDEEGNVYILTGGKGCNSYLEVFNEHLQPIGRKKLKGESQHYIFHKNGKIYITLNGRTKYPSYFCALGLS